MTIIELLEDYLTGNKLIDMVIIAMMFQIFNIFYSLFFDAIFSIFKKN